jgi:hypothetical protein
MSKSQLPILFKQSVLETGDVEHLGPVGYLDLFPSHTEQKAAVAAAVLEHGDDEHLVPEGVLGPFPSHTEQKETSRKRDRVRVYLKRILPTMKAVEGFTRDSTKWTIGFFTVALICAIVGSVFLGLGFTSL